MKKILLITFCILSLCGCEESENLQDSSKSSKIEEKYTIDNNPKNDSKLEDVKNNTVDKNDKINNNTEINNNTNKNSSTKNDSNNSSKTTTKNNNPSTKENTTTKKKANNSSSKKSSPADTNADASTRLPLKAICKDGSISYQDNPEGETYRGMCSHHGGIKTKLGRVK